ncbi:MAG: secretin N-terminal domain-containing protein [Candidatus Ancaeobacter aquaticus]|nr:secretin N-terminal domain-containing protein [Candidatus Ancaeobacter aquaticus]
MQKNKLKYYYAGLCIVTVFLLSIAFTKFAFTADEVSPAAQDVALEAVSQVIEGNVNDTDIKKDDAVVSPENIPAPDAEKTISFDFPDTDIRVALETIGIKVGVNIVAGPEVKGKISMKLEDVSWRKALDILLKTYGYGHVQDDGIIRVMSIENLKKEEMMTALYTLQYGDPVEIAKGVQALLSDEGKVEPNVSSRSIIIKDYPRYLNSIEKTIKKLDQLAKKDAPEKKSVLKEEVKGVENEIKLDFKEKPIRDVMSDISAISGINISVGEEVDVKVTLTTNGKFVPWRKAFNTIINTAELEYQPSDKMISEFEPGDFITIRKKQKINEIILDYKDEPIRDVMSDISGISGVYISVGEEVDVKVTLTTDGKFVPWRKAFETIMRTANLTYQPSDKLISDIEPGDFITIRTKQKIIEISDYNKIIANSVPLIYEVFELKYVDAEDVKKLLDPKSEESSLPRLLSARGCVTILSLAGQTGWSFRGDPKDQGGGGGGAAGRPEMSIGERAEKKPSKSRTLLVGEVPSNMENVRQIINTIDVMPYQIMIEAKIVEVDRDVLRDIGFEWGSGFNGIEAGLLGAGNGGHVVTQKLTEGGASVLENLKMGFQNLSYDTNMTPSSFNPNSTGLNPDTSGFKFKMEKLLNTQVEVILHMLEENSGANILSAPKIMTYSNQEASIVVGTEIPLLSTEITPSAVGQPTVSAQFNGYLPVGIRLSVVPQVSNKKYINMILHPTVTSRLYDMTIIEPNTRIPLITYPVLETREADTQILLGNGETVVIGGLLKDEKKETRIGVPFLSDLPFIGELFRRTVTSTKKIDLLIFVKATIVLKGRGADESVRSYVLSKKEGEKLLSEGTNDSIYTGEE